MSVPATVRKAVKAQHPDLKFKIRKVGFADLARGESYFLESDAWGMCEGNQETFDNVEAIVASLDVPVIVSWE